MQIRNKKQIISTIVTVLVSTFLVAGVVFAVTTVGTKVLIGSDTTTNAVALSHNDTTGDFGLVTYTKLATDMAGGWYAGSDSYNTVAVTQTGNTSVFGSISELDLATGTTFSSSNAGGMWADLEMLGTVNLGASAAETPSYSAAVVATLVSTTTGVTVPANRVLAGIVVDSAMTASYTNSGVVSGIVIRRNSSSAAVWPVGLTITSGSVTTDISLQNGETITNSPDGVVAISGGVKLPQDAASATDAANTTKPTGITCSATTKGTITWVDDTDTTGAWIWICEKTGSSSYDWYRAQ